MRKECSENEGISHADLFLHIFQEKTIRVKLFLAISFISRPKYLKFKFRASETANENVCVFDERIRIRKEYNQKNMV